MEIAQNTPVSRGSFQQVKCKRAEAKPQVTAPWACAKGQMCLATSSLQMFYLNLSAVISGDLVLVWILLPIAPALGDK